MLEKEDLTLSKMFDALQLIGGHWPSNKVQVTRQSFNCSSSATRIDFTAHQKIRELGFEDVVINVEGGTASFDFIWKKEPQKK